MVERAMTVAGRRAGPVSAEPGAPEEAVGSRSRAGVRSHTSPILRRSARTVGIADSPRPDGKDAEAFAEPASLEHLVPILYDELRDLARGHLAREVEGHTLDTTGLVHEAYLKLADSTGVGRQGRAYFFGAAARAMRQVLVEHARRRKAAKRGGGDRPVTLDTRRGKGDASGEDVAADVLDLERALLALESTHPRLVRVVECRFFAGMSVAETAEALDVSTRTVKYDWALARARLHRALSDGEGEA